jgi:folylpolyglutamate synthase/dihydropteroate synthase
MDKSSLGTDPQVPAPAEPLFPRAVKLGSDADQRRLESLGYQQALARLYDRINYEKIGHAPYTANHYRLDRMRALLAALDAPHSKYPILHIAGTKGKGTAATVLHDCLVACGYRTGLYTSPHLLRLEERIRIDGECCPPEELVQITETVLDAAQRIEAVGHTAPTFFELTTAMGMLHFANRRVDCVVLEVGLGGRLDSTNVCSPLVSIITAISLDHQVQLGGTIPLIAAEKAGIIKTRVPVVCVARNPEAQRVVAEIAAQREAPIALIGRQFEVDWHPIHNPMPPPAAAPHKAPPVVAARETDAMEATTAEIPSGRGTSDASGEIEPTNQPPLPAEHALGPRHAYASLYMRSLSPDLFSHPASASRLGEAVTPASLGEKSTGQTGESISSWGSAGSLSNQAEAAIIPPTSSAPAAGTLLEKSSASWQVPMLGRHQADNVAAAVVTLEYLRRQGWNLPSARLRQAVAGALPSARLQVVGEAPLRIVDTAHNPASIQAGLEALNDHFPSYRRIVLFASSRDKDYHDMLRQLLPNCDHLILTTYRENPRGLPVQDLLNAAKVLREECRLAGCSAPAQLDQANSPGEGWESACTIAGEFSEQDSDLVLVLGTGSFFLAAELLQTIEGSP